MNQRFYNAPLVACAALTILAGCATMQTGPHQSLTAPLVPAALAVQPGQTLSLIANAKGVQIYSCAPGKAGPGKYEWLLKAPDATLFDAHGQSIGKHYAGPTWESTDGSKVAGEVKASEKSSNANSIAWLLLSVKANSDASALSNMGNPTAGVLTKITAVQRINTVGGMPPVDGCDLARAGKELRVPYTADYYFYN